MQPIDISEIEVPMLLMGRAHRLHLRRDVALDDAVSMRNPAVGAFPGADAYELMSGGHDRRLRLPQRIFGQRMQRDEAHLVIQAFEPAERVEHALAPQEFIGSGGKLVAIGTELQFGLRTMIPEVARNDAVLQHPAECDAVTSGRPGQFSRQGEIGRQQHSGANNDGQAGARQRRNRNPPAQEWPRNPACAAEPEQHRQCGAVGRASKRGEHKQREFFEPGNLVVMKHQKKKREDRQSGKNIRQQHAGEPRQRGGNDQCERQPKYPHRTDDAEHPQGQLKDPQRRQRLNAEIEPKARALAEMKIKAEHGRAAGDQITLVPAGQIAAGIPLEQRIAVPQCWREQHRRDGDGRCPRPGWVCHARAQHVRTNAVSLPTDFDHHAGPVQSTEIHQ